MILKWIATGFLAIMIFGTLQGMLDDVEGRRYGTLRFGLLGFLVTMVAIWS